MDLLITDIAKEANLAGRKERLCMLMSFFFGHGRNRIWLLDWSAGIIPADREYFFGAEAGLAWESLGIQAEYLRQMVIPNPVQTSPWMATMSRPPISWELRPGIWIYWKLRCCYCQDQISRLTWMKPGGLPACEGAEP